MNCCGALLGCASVDGGCSRYCRLINAPLRARLLRNSFVSLLFSMEVIREDRAVDVDLEVDAVGREVRVTRRTARCSFPLRPGQQTGSLALSVGAGMA